jgi:uncharacterized protein with HEPN domain
MEERLFNKLLQIRDAARQACEFVEGMDREDFIEDSRTHKACALNLIIIGEAAKRITARYPDVFETYPQIPWKFMTGMRNQMAHGYEHVDQGVVWKTITEDLPTLITQIDELLSQ